MVETHFRPKGRPQEAYEFECHRCGRVFESEGTHEIHRCPFCYTTLIVEPRAEARARLERECRLEPVVVLPVDTMTL